MFYNRNSHDKAIKAQQLNFLYLNADTSKRNVVKAFLALRASCKIFN